MGATAGCWPLAGGHVSPGALGQRFNTCAHPLPHCQMGERSREEAEQEAAVPAVRHSSHTASSKGQTSTTGQWCKQSRANSPARHNGATMATLQPALGQLGDVLEPGSAQTWVSGDGQLNNSSGAPRMWQHSRPRGQSLWGQPGQAEAALPVHHRHPKVFSVPPACPQPCLTPTGTAPSQHGMGESQSGAGHPHTKTLKLATPAAPLHPKPATSGPLPHSLAPASGFIGSNTGEAAPHTSSKIPTRISPEDRAGSACAPHGRQELLPTPCQLLCPSQCCPQCQQELATGAGLQEP